MTSGPTRQSNAYGDNRANDSLNDHGNCGDDGIDASTDGRNNRTLEAYV